MCFLPIQSTQSIMSIMSTIPGQPMARPDCALRRHSHAATLLVLLARTTRAIVVAADPRRSSGNFDGRRLAESMLNIGNVLIFIRLDSDEHLNPVLIA